MIRPIRRRVLFAFLTVAAMAALTIPALAVAHSELETSTPADGATVPSPFDGPITLGFSAALADGSKAELLGPGGVSIAAATVDRPGAAMAFTLDGALPAGNYEIKWTTVAEDTDVARGTIAFSVATAASTPAPTTTPSPSPTASAGSSPSAEPASSSPSAAPSSPPSIDPAATGSAADVLIPIVVALVVIGAGAAYLLRRRNRPPTSG